MTRSRTGSLAAAALLAAATVGLVAPGSASAASVGSAHATAAAVPSSTPVAIHSGWFGLKAFAKATTCLDSNAGGSVYTLPCQVPGNKYQDWNWTEWQAYSPYSGYYYFYSLQDQATGRCLDSNAAGQVYTTNPCQAPGNAYQDWNSPGFASSTGTTFTDTATGLALYQNVSNTNVFTGGPGDYNSFWFPIQ
ncbi:hypothetical protein [Catenulispora sp. EB89]|uniref:RICIN domain-containing protein n=1 Tax=Catenulispora sp. EB89 TaxID=3156257 RepID=UPI003515507E